MPCLLYTSQRKGRMIVIDSHLPKVLESLQKLKDKKEINQIKVVIGSMGYGYQNWEPRFKTTDFIASRKKARKYAMELLKEKVDDVYLTESDNGKEKVLDICLESVSYTHLDVIITEIGGTVGDIESLPFLEAIRQWRRDVGYNNTFYVHTTLIPFVKAASELKTKPTQHSVKELRSLRCV